MRLVIPLIVKSIDVRYLNRAVLAVNRFYRIHHEDPAFDAALECAGFHLNELGMNLFHSAILEYEKRAPNLAVERVTIDETGSMEIVALKETYTGRENNVTVEYKTTKDDCPCRRFLKKGICLHMIHFRLESNLPLFESSMFLRGRLLKDVTAYDHMGEDTAANEHSVDEPAEADIYERDNAKSSKKPVSATDKWHVANEVTKEITENVARYNGKHFEEAMEFLTVVQNLTRTHGFNKDIMQYLKAPEKFTLIPVVDVPLLSSSQFDQLNSQIDSFNRLATAPVNAPERPVTPERRAWPQSPFPGTNSPSHFVYRPPNPSTPSRTPASQYPSTPQRRTAHPSTPTSAQASQSTPRARAERFSNPPQSPLVSGRSSNLFKSPATSPHVSRPGFIRRLRPRPPSSSARPKLPVRMSPELIKSFIELSANNSSIEVETGATFGGFLSACKTYYVVDHLFVPDQIGFSRSYNDTDDGSCAELMVDRDRLNLGTIHTHPGNLESFMSSVDLHMHCQIQRYCASAVAFVHSPGYNTTPAFTLTDLGLGNTSYKFKTYFTIQFLGVVLSCSANGRDGHPHHETNLYAKATNVVWDNDLRCIVEDLRTNVFNPPQLSQPTPSTPTHPSGNSSQESDIGTPYTPPQTRTNSFRTESFHGMQFPKAARGRGRPPTKRKNPMEPRRNYSEDDFGGGKLKMHLLCLYIIVFFSRVKPISWNR